MDERYRRNPEFILREIAGESILVPTGQAALAFNGLASLNASGVFLWGLLERWSGMWCLDARSEQPLGI